VKSENKPGTKNLARWGWIIWSMLALAYVIVYFHRVALAVVMDYLMVDLEIHEAAVAGTLAGMYSIIYLVMQVPSGVLADFLGARKTVTSGLVVASAGSILFALASAAPGAFLGRIIVGVGVSVIYVSILKVLTTWFRPHQFATMTGLTVLAGNLGGAMGTTPLALLVESFGWRNAFMLVGAVTLLVALICWTLVRNTPEQFQGIQLLEKDNKGVSPGGAKKLSETWKNLTGALKKVIANPKTWPPFVSAFGVYGTMIAFSGAWSVNYLMQVYELSRGEAANYMLAVTVGMMVGCPLVGLISDKMGRRRTPHLALFVAYIFIWILFFTWNGGKPPLSMLYPLFFLMGFTGSNVVTIFAMAKELNSPDYSGIALGVVNMGGFTGIAIMQPLLGYVLDLRWQGEVLMGAKLYPLEAYRLMLATCLVILLACFLVALRIKETRCQNVYHEARPKQSSQATPGI